MQTVISTRTEHQTFLFFQMCTAQIGRDSVLLLFEGLDHCDLSQNDYVNTKTKENYLNFFSDFFLKFKYLQYQRIFFLSMKFDDHDRIFVF